MKKPFQLNPLKDTALVTLKNKSARYDFDKKTGWMRSMAWPEQKIDLFQQIRGGIPGYIGGIRVYDEHDRVMYSDLESEFTVRKFTQAGKTVSFQKQFKGAPFVLTVTFKLDADCLLWQVDAVKANKKVEDRSLRVYFFLPLIAGWNVWAPCKFGELTFDGMTPFEIMYTQIPYVSDQEVILPMFSHFNRTLNAGYSVVEPIDENVPAAKFGFNNMDKSYNWGSMKKDLRDAPVLETENYCIGLVGDRKMSTKIMVFLHEGDWRPGLGKVYSRWREFFDPFNDAIYEREGSFLCGGVGNSDEADKMAAMGLKTMEVHGHFENYSDYFQDGKDKWYHIGVSETVYHTMLKERKEKARTQKGSSQSATVTAQEVDDYINNHTPDEIAKYIGYENADKMYHHRDDIHRRLKILRAHGISPHWYFNYTDGFRPWVERRWPDAISKAEDGSPIPSGWYMCHNMNADPRWSFGKFCFESAKKIFDEYPELDGFFLDCFRHYEIDFAHDDGVTVVNGKPCYSINRSYDDIERLIKTRIMKPRNKTLFANKPMSIRSMRYCDGQLLEGDGDMYEEKFFWASIACPMFYLWGDPFRSVDEFLRRSVLNGCYPTLAERTEENIKLYKKYLPLYKQFHRRVFCFDPDPMRPPKASRGKLYTVKDGYVAGIMDENIDVGDEVKRNKTPYALFRVQRGHDVTRAGVMLPGNAELRMVKFKFDGTFIAVPMEGYVNCAVVKLFTDRHSGKKIGTDLFQMRDRMCGDPDSAFEDVSWR